MAREIGQLHNLIIWVPLVLLVLAAVGEVLLMRKRGLLLAGAARLCLVVGALGGLAAVVSGFLWADVTGRGSQTHRWFGVGVLVCGVAAWILARRASGSRTARLGYRILLLLSALLVAYAAHLGHALTT